MGTSEIGYQISSGKKHSPNSISLKWDFAISPCALVQTLKHRLLILSACVCLIPEKINKPLYIPLPRLFQAFLRHQKSTKKCSCFHSWRWPPEEFVSGHSAHNQPCEKPQFKPQLPWDSPAAWLKAGAQGCLWLPSSVVFVFLFLCLCVPPSFGAMTEIRGIF